MANEESPLLNSSDGDGNSLYYDAGFRNSLEYLFPTILNNAVAYRTLIIDKSDVIQAHGDFYRICAKKSNLSRAYWWIMLRLNGFNHPNEYVGDRVLEQVLVPDPAYFDDLIRQYMTVRPVSH